MLRRTVLTRWALPAYDKLLALQVFVLPMIFSIKGLQAIYENFLWKKELQDI